MTLAHRFRAWLLLMVSFGVLFSSVATGQGVEQPRVPVRKALDEIRVLRAEYSEAFNKDRKSVV